jgi:hypothetical protein
MFARNILVTYKHGWRRSGRLKASFVSWKYYSTAYEVSFALQRFWNSNGISRFPGESIDACRPMNHSDEAVHTCENCLWFLYAVRLVQDLVCLFKMNAH